MATTYPTNSDGTPDMRFKVNKQFKAAELRRRVRAKQEALELARRATEAVKAPVKVEPVVCVCCMDEEATQKGHAKLDCGHMYCISCFSQHARLSNKCPLCRTSFAPEPKKEREKIPAFVISDQVQERLDQMIPTLEDAENVFSFLAYGAEPCLNSAPDLSDGYNRLFSLLRNECLTAAISVANWYEPSSDYGFHNTNQFDISASAHERNERVVRANNQAQESQEALEHAAENIAAASAGNIESVDMEIDPNPPPGFAPRRLFAEEDEHADRRGRVLVSDGFDQGSSSLARAAARATELVGNEYPGLTSSESVEGNPAEPDFIPLESMEFDAMAALAARDNNLMHHSPPEDGEIVEDDTLEEYFDQAVREAQNELAEAEQQRESRRTRAARRHQAQEDAENSFTTPLRRQTHDGILYNPDVYFNED